MNRDKIKGHLAILLASVIFGLNISITKGLMAEGWIDSMGVTYARMIVACVAFWVASLFVPHEPVTRRDLVILFFGGFLGIMLNQASFIIGLDYTAPIDAGLVLTITPVLVMIFSAIFLKEPISVKKAGGVFLGAAGAILIVLSSVHGHTAMARNPLLGNLLVLLSCCSYGTYLIITRSIMQRYSPITLMKWMFLFAAIMALPLGAKHVLSAKALSPEAGFDVWWRMAYFTLGATFITYLLIPVALKRIRPTTVCMYNYVQPLVATIAAIMLGQDTLSWQKPVAAVLIFTGVYMVTQSRAREDVERDEMQNRKP